MSEELRDHLIAVASPVLDSLELQRWTSGGDGDPGQSYCGVCIEKHIAANPGKGMVADGGWDQQSDTPQVCETCGCPLEYSLTDAGATQELDHFERAEIVITPQTAYELLELIDSAEHLEELSGRVETLRTRVLEAIE